MTSESEEFFAPISDLKEQKKKEKSIWQEWAKEGRREVATLGVGEKWTNLTAQISDRSAEERRTVGSHCTAHVMETNLSAAFSGSSTYSAFYVTLFSSGVDGLHKSDQINLTQIRSYWSSRSSIPRPSSISRYFLISRAILTLRTSAHLLPILRVPRSTYRV